MDESYNHTTLSQFVLEALDAFESMKYEPPESHIHRDRLGVALVGISAHGDNLRLYVGDHMLLSRARQVTR